MRAPIALALLVLTLPAVRASADGEPATDPHGGIFYREPDSDTAAEIKKAIATMANGSVDARRNSRDELRSIGFWSVEPLIAAVSTQSPQIRCASVLVLDAIRDPRAVEPLRAAISRETTDRYIAAFAALALGRCRDAAAIDVFRTAVKTTKTMDLLKAAVPIAAAKIRTPEARDLVLERVRVPAAKEPVRSAAVLALGFFPELALSGNGTTPGPDLATALEGKRGERQAAVLAFLVAASGRSDVKSALRDMLANEQAQEVSTVLLIGLCRSPDADVTEILARTASKQGDEKVRELAADLLLDRVDAATLPVVVQTARSNASARLRAACVLALGAIEDDSARKVVFEKLGDRAPLVRAAAGVALTRRNVPGLREAAIAALEPRIKRGETNDDVRANFEKARAVLAGERTDVRWTEIGPEALFSEMPLTPTQRLLRAVNQRVMASLDLEKIQNLQTDSEIVPVGPGVTPPGDSNEHDEPGGGIDPGSGDGGTPTTPGDTPTGQPNADGPAVGAPRTSQYQELRDLKIELLRRPIFAEPDLPMPPTTPGAPK